MYFLLLQPVDLKICHLSFHHLLHSRPHRHCLFHSWPLPWPAATAGLWQGPTPPRLNHPLEDRSSLPFPENLQLYLDTGVDPTKR